MDRPKRKKQPPLILTLGTPLLLIVGGVVAYWTLTYRQANLAAVPVGASVIPRSAPLTLTLSTDPAQWEPLQKFGTPRSRALVQDALQQWRDRWLTHNGYTYERDIQPWLGDAFTLAILPRTAPVLSSTQAQASSPYAFLLVLPIADPALAKQILSKPQAPAGRAWVERAYRGFAIFETPGDPAQTLSLTVLDNRYGVLTTDPKVTEQAIDAYRGDNVLTTPGYRRAFASIEVERPLAQLYLNVPAAATLSLSQAPKSLPSQALTQLQQQQGIAVNAQWRENGIALQGVSWLKPDSSFKNRVANTASKMADRLPDSTFMMFTGGNLQHLWQDYTQSAEANPNSPINPDSLRVGVKSLTGMDLEQDWLRWMDGEFAVALLKPSATDRPQFAAGLTFMVQASDRRAAETALQTLDRFVQERYRFKVEPVEINRQPVTQWSPPLAVSHLTVTHGWLEGNTVFLTIGPAIAEQFVPRPRQPLSRSEPYRATVPMQLNPNNGHFYLDLSQPLHSRLLPLPSDRQPLLESIQAIGVTAAVNDQRTTRYDVFVKLKRGTP
ncbi:DUF3352 domain-containing protein [Trichothermofontia sp.]